MKAVIQKVIFKKEIPGKHGTLYSFDVYYDDEKAVYRSKSKNQKHFTPGQETEFTVEEMTWLNKETGEEVPYKVIKPIYGGSPQNPFGRALKKEQSRYSGFAMAYAKDLVVADKIKIDNLVTYAQFMFDKMVEMDKTLES